MPTPKNSSSVFLLVLLAACSQQASPPPTVTPTSVPSPTSSPHPTLTSRPLPTKTPSPEPPPYSPDSTWDRYVPRTPHSIVESTIPEVRPGPDLLFWINAGDDFASMVTVEYTGEFRDIPGERWDFVRLWAPFAYGITEQQSKVLFAQEGRFVENGIDYWMPVQAHLIPYMKEELEIGQQVDLLVVWPGVNNEDGVSTWIFIVNTF